MPGHKTHRKVIITTSIVAIAMFGFSFALVPFYGRICKLTGINISIADKELSKPSLAALSTNAVDLQREITVQFIAVTHKNLPWDFYPETRMIKVHPGQNTKVYFYVKNENQKAMTIQAIPSMTPIDAISHFHKIECFCFRQQSLGALQSKDMPLIFQVDKDLPKEIRTITLAYTLFDATPTDEPRKT